MTKTPNPKTTKSKSKPKRKPREWRIIIDENGLIVYPGTLSETQIPKYLQSIKVREVIE